MSQAVNLPEIISYQITLFNSQIIHRPIYEIDVLDEILKQYGRGYIAQITFYIHNPLHRYYYLILRNSEHKNMFVVEFYHYYNYRFEALEMPLSNQNADYQAVMQVLSSTENMDLRLKKYVFDPFKNMV